MNSKPISLPPIDARLSRLGAATDYSALVLSRPAPKTEPVLGFNLVAADGPPQTITAVAINPADLMLFRTEGQTGQQLFHQGRPLMWIDDLQVSETADGFTLTVAYQAPHRPR